MMEILQNCVVFISLVVLGYFGLRILIGVL